MRSGYEELAQDKPNFVGDSNLQDTTESTPSGDSNAFLSNSMLSDAGELPVAITQISPIPGSQKISLEPDEPDASLDTSLPGGAADKPDGGVQSTCTDGVLNQIESAIDCGGNCNPCSVGQTCNQPDDCLGSSCVAGVCQATCFDTFLNQNETAIDCGGVCAPCSIGNACTLPADCLESNCIAGTCQATCFDTFLNQDETAVDCGGGCRSCDWGESCQSGADCVTAECNGGTCIGWPYFKAITIDPSLLSEALVNYPLLISVPLEAELATNAGLAGGGDIYFTESDGFTRLEHEIEEFNNSTGELVAWVKVPLISASVATTLFLHYGNPSAADQQNAVGVWDSTYESVWHLSQDPGPGGVDQILDSTGSSHGTAHGSMTSSDSVSGPIGRAINFDGVDDELRYVNSFVGTGPHSISAWVNQQTTSETAAIIAFGEDSFNQARWLYSSFSAGNSIAAGFYTNDWLTTQDIRQSGWKHLVWTYNGSESRLYIDGALADSTAHNGANTTGTNGWIGNVYLAAPNDGFGPEQHLDGELDELRVLSRVLTPSWIASEFLNHSSPTTFAILGPQELKNP